MKKYINRLFIGALVAGASLLVFSCSSDYLNTAPTDSIGTGDAVGTTDQCHEGIEWNC